MLNKSQKLNKNLFKDDVEQVPIRSGFGKGLLEAGEKDERIVGLCADLTGSTKMNMFADKFQNRFIQVGVAEQNLASVASGMAAMGKIPFISSYAMFSPGRNWEQIRTTICYNDVPVKIAGSHAGISVGPDGGTHQAVEDIALMRVLPNMVVISPCDAIEAKKATIAAAKTKEPTYIRLAREKTPVITTEDTPFEIGKAQIMFSPEDETIDADVLIIATGALLYKALQVAQKIETEQHKKITVVNLATIKPIDEKTLVPLIENCKSIVTVEEHQIAGGMGSVIAELCARTTPRPIEFVGVDNEFGQSGTPEELLEYYGMGVDSITAAVKRALER